MLVAVSSQSMFGLGLYEAIRMASRVGFDGIELLCATPHFGLDRAMRDFEAVEEALERARLRLVALTVPTNLTDPFTLKEELEAAQEFIKVARRVGTDCVVVNAGRPTSLRAMHDRWETCVAALQLLSSAAQRRGVRLVVSVQRNSLADTPAGVATLLKQVGDGAMGVLLDTGFVLENKQTVESYVQFLNKSLTIVRIQDVAVGRQDSSWAALGAGSCDFHSVVAALKVAKFAGPVSLACRHAAEDPDPLEKLARELRKARSLLAVHQLAPAGSRV